MLIQPKKFRQCLEHPKNKCKSVGSGNAFHRKFVFSSVAFSAQGSVHADDNMLEFVADCHSSTANFICYMVFLATP